MLDILHKLRLFLDSMQATVDNFVAMVEGFLNKFSPIVGAPIGAFNFGPIFDSLKAAALQWVLANLPKLFSAPVSAELA